VTALLFLLPFLSHAGETSEPPPPDIEIFTDGGIYQWVETNPYMKKFTATQFREDLQLSGQFIRLLSAGNKLEQQLGFQPDPDTIKELMNSPVEISLWDAFETDKTTTFLFIMDIKPQFQAGYLPVPNRPVVRATPNLNRAAQSSNRTAQSWDRAAQSSDRDVNSSDRSAQS